MLVTIQGGTPNDHVVVHRAGCREVVRERATWCKDVEVSSQLEAALTFLPPARDGYDPADEFRDYEVCTFMPCVKDLPVGLDEIKED